MIGIGIVTYNREKEFSDIIKSLPKNFETFKIVAVKDGGKAAYKNRPYFDFYELKENKGVGFCKNLCLQHLLDAGCDDIFILEDDALILDNSVWNYCINFSRETGLLHFNWNNYRREDNMHVPAEYPSFKALISYNTEANFSYFHREFLKDIRFDTEFVNAWEHVDLEYQGVMKGFLPAFRMFVSPMGLEKYIRVHDNGRSTILDQPEHQERIKQGYEYWKNKWGVDIKDLHPISMEQFVKNTKKIREAYGRP